MSATFEDLRSGGMKRVLDRLAEDHKPTPEQLRIAHVLLSKCGPLQLSIDNFISRPIHPHESAAAVGRDWEAATDLLSATVAITALLVRDNPGTVEFFDPSPAVDHATGRRQQGGEERGRRVFS